MEATAALLGEVAGSWGQADKFGHFVGDVEAKSGYGSFQWVLASYVGSI